MNRLSVLMTCCLNRANAHQTTMAWMNGLMKGVVTVVNDLGERLWMHSLDGQFGLDEGFDEQLRERLG